MAPHQLEPKDFDSMDETMAEIYRGMTEAERLQVAFRLWRTVRREIELAVMAERPELSGKELQLAVGMRMLSEEHPLRYATAADVIME